MGIRIDAYAVDLPRFAEFLNTTLGDLLNRYQRDGKNPDERLRFTCVDSDDTYFASPGGSIAAWIGSGPERHLEELTAERIRNIGLLQIPAHEHLSQGSIYEPNWLLRGFSNCRGIDFIERVLDGQRRWWIGSILQFAHKYFEHSEYEELELLFRKVLRHANCGFEIQKNDPGFATEGLPFTPHDDPDLPFGRWSDKESFAVASFLSRILELSPTFTRPRGPIGIAPDDSEWHQWVSANVEALIRIADFDFKVCNVLTFIG